jgi:hypothetical protein
MVFPSHFVSARACSRAGVATRLRRATGAVSFETVPEDRRISVTHSKQKRYAALPVGKLHAQAAA